MPVAALTHTHPVAFRYCNAQVGWKHQAAVEELEGKRKEAAKAFYVAKKKQIALRLKAAAKIAA